jgi:RNA polymerase sigma factor (sigma-70 family)
MPATRDPYSVEFYEGLCRKTASIYVKYVEEEYEDIVQLLHIKCWRALETYDPQKATQTVDKYVFMCMKNLCKDLVKKKKREELHIDDIAPTMQSDSGHDVRDAFDLHYLGVREDEVYGEAEEELPLIPSTLTETERAVVCLLFSDYRQKEIAVRLGIDRNLVGRAIKSIRVKMADWAPSPEPVACAPVAA